MSARWVSRQRARDPGEPFDAARAKLIVGLGNPGVRYASSRHNVGFIVLDRLAAAEQLAWGRRRFNALLAAGVIAGRSTLLAKPQTFMNLSGSAVGKLVSFYHFPNHDIIVVYDDLDLPFGRIRLRARGSAGGHHGMESISAALGHGDFARLRVGIGRPESREDVSHVLGRFTEDEQSELVQVVARAGDALRVWLSDGIEKAMNQFSS